MMVVMLVVIVIVIMVEMMMEVLYTSGGIYGHGYSNHGRDDDGSVVH
jgi:hypothetical protein